MTLDIQWVRQQSPDRQITYYDSIPSTMPEAARLAADGAASGTTIVAGEQTAGQGRYGRLWHSEPDSGLYFSVVLRQNFSPETLPVITLALGLAVTEAIQQTTDLTCDLRWPNDILVNERKAAGILTQLEGQAVIAGIGINVNHSAFPAELGTQATSLRIASGREQSREKILVSILPAIDSYCALLAGEGKQPILDMFSHASSYVHGRRVTVEQGDSILNGTTAGLNDAGFLLLKNDDGKQNVIIAGGVRPCS